MDLLLTDEMLSSIVISAAVLTAFGHYLGYTIIKHQSATQKNTVALAKITIVWTFFMLWPYKGHETFNFIKLVAIAIVFGGIFWFTNADYNAQEAYKE